MNWLVFSTVNVVVLLVASLSYAADSKLGNPYVASHSFKSAVIQYTIRNEYSHDAMVGSTQDARKRFGGTEVIYIKNDTHVKLMKVVVPGSNGKIKNVEQLEIFTPEYIYKIDLIRKTGTKIHNSKKYGKAAYEKLSVKEKEAFHNRMSRAGIVSLDLLGVGKKVGSETLLGYVCDVYEVGKALAPGRLLEPMQNEEEYFYMKSWIWWEAKVPLKIIISRVGWSQELITTKIERDIKIPDSRFMVPADITITYDKEKSEWAKRVALATFERLKTGKLQVIRMKVEKKVKRLKEKLKVTRPLEKSGKNQK